MQFISHINFAEFAARRGLMQHYRAGDRVNLVRGPGDEPGRPVVVAAEVDCADRGRLAEDAWGRLVPESVGPDHH